MSILARYARPGTITLALAVAAVVVLERSAAGIPVALLGAVVGALAGLAALQVGMLLGAIAFGARVGNVVIGVGRRWKEWVTPRRTIALRGLPVLLSVGIGPGRTPRRPRMWAAALVSAVVSIAVVALLWWLASGPWGRGVAIGATAAVAHALIPQQTATSTSTGWVLFGMPRQSPREAAEMEAGALADAALSAVNAGDLPAADAAIDAMAGEFPDARATAAARVAVLEAHGRYAEALSAVLGLASDPAQTPRDAAFAMAGLAGIAITAVEAGQAPADAALPLARQAIDDAVQLGYPSFKLDGTRAVLALLDGDTDAAARLARTAAGVGDHALSRADDLATLARALMAAGDNRGARVALGEAESLAAWWPRVAATRVRLDV